MKKIIIIGMVLVLVLTGVLSGCLDKYSIYGKVVEVKPVGGLDNSITLVFDDGQIMDNIVFGGELVILNKTGTFYFSDRLFGNQKNLDRVVYDGD